MSERIASVTVRGVTYSARVLPVDGSIDRVQLAVNGRVIGRADLTIRLDGPMLGGNATAATEIYTKLEHALARLLAELAGGVS